MLSLIATSWTRLPSGYRDWFSDSSAVRETYLPGATELRQEEFFPCFLFGPAVVKAPVTTVFQNINFSNNSQSIPVT